MNSTKKVECIFISGESKCLGKSHGCYGGYCKKHRDLFLLKDGLIDLDKFTGESKDYKLCDLKKFCNKHITKLPSQSKKQDYFEKVKNHHSHNCKLLENIDSIKKIQSNVRRWILCENVKNKGLGYIKREVCNNTEDFYTYDPLSDIESRYFYSYKDSQNNYWGFDIRSLKKLMDMNYGNPYTTEEFPNEIKLRVNSIISKLNNSNIETTIDNTIVSDRKAMMKQKFVDIFAQMEYVGYSCDVKWVLELNNQKLKKLYRELEDVWNYRAHLSIESKREIVPPNGRLCEMPVHDYNHCSNRLELQEILANEISKFSMASTQASMSLGYMYFIIALSYVSRPCFMTHNWVQSIF